MAVMSSASQFALAYVAGLVTLLVLDGVWLGLIAKSLYRREMGALMRPKIKAAPALVFYVLYPAALVFLCLWTQPSGVGEALARGAVLGLAAYGAYNLTNLAVVAHWPGRLSAIDLAWGTLATAITAAAAYEAAWLLWRR